MRLRLVVDLGFLSRFLAAAVAGASFGDNSASESGRAVSSAVDCCSAVALSPLLAISTVLFACDNEAGVVVVVVDAVEDKEQF